MTRETDEPISFYVPARNAAETLADCVDAVRNQTRVPDELFLLVDPRSTDATVDVAHGLSVKVIHQTGPTLGAARNEAILAAAHPWIASCDSDVIIERDWLERLADRREADLAGIGGRTHERVRNANDQWRALHMPHHWGAYPLRNPFMLVSEVLFRRDALLNVGGYRDDLNYYEDSDLCQRLREAGYDLLYEPSAIATHQRTDSLLGLLTLRWKYSEYRQKGLLDRYAGLLTKCDVNREYATNTLSRSLARGFGELSYISFLLYFHHLVMDLRSMLSRRPLIDPAAKKACERQAADAATAPLGDRHPETAGAVRAHLDELIGASSTDVGEACATAGWRHYLERLADAADRYCASFDPDLFELFCNSAEHVAGMRPAREVQSATRLAHGEMRARLESIPIKPFVDHAFVRSLRERWPDMGKLRVAGDVTPQERTVLDELATHASSSDARTVAVAAHLESRPDPLGVFEAIEPDADRLVVCYQPPASFVSGLEVPSASDLAEAAAAAGWTIVQFDTLVGRTRLMLERAAAVPVTANAGR